LRKKDRQRLLKEEPDGFTIVSMSKWRIIEWPFRALWSIVTLDYQDPKTIYQRGSKVALEVDEESLHIQRPQKEEVRPETL
jgi:hypothetical protein